MDNISNKNNVQSTKLSFHCVFYILLSTFYILHFTLYFVLFTSAAPAHAQQVSLAVSPPVVEILLSPNKSIEQTFHLDTSGSDLTVTPELHLAKPSDLTGHMSIDPNPVIPSALPLSFKISGPSTSPTLTLEAASTDISQDVYLALVFKVGNENDLSSSTAIPGISALILVTINKDGIVPINLEISDFTPPLIHDSWQDLTLAPVLKNSTPIMLRPQGKYEVISPTGKNVFSSDIYQNLILGNSSRKIYLSDSSLLTWSPKWYQLGPYRLQLTILTQGGTKLTQIEKVVWVIPLRISLIMALLGIIIFRLTHLKQNTRVDS